MKDPLTNFVGAHAEAIQRRWRARSSELGLFPGAPPEALATMTGHAFAALRAHICEGDGAGLAAMADGIVNGRLPVHDRSLVRDGFRAFLSGRAAINDVLADEIADVGERRRLQRDVAERVDRACAEYFRRYSGLRTTSTLSQAAELGTEVPVLQLWDRLLVMPLIGQLDTVRASRIKHSLLESIADHEARIVIVDITGISSIDSEVAHHLLDAMRSVELLGTELVLTGVSPHNAKILADLDVDLGTITPCGSLQAGLKRAFDRLGVAVDRVTVDRAPGAEEVPRG